MSENKEECQCDCNKAECCENKTCECCKDGCCC